MDRLPRERPLDFHRHHAYIRRRGAYELILRSLL